VRDLVELLALPLEPFRALLDAHFLFDVDRAENKVVLVVACLADQAQPVVDRLAANQHTERDALHPAFLYGAEQTILAHIVCEDMLVVGMDDAPGDLRYVAEKIPTALLDLERAEIRVQGIPFIFACARVDIAHARIVDQQGFRDPIENNVISGHDLLQFSDTARVGANNDTYSFL